MPNSYPRKRHKETFMDEPVSGETTVKVTEPFGNFGKPIKLLPISPDFQAYRSLFEAVESGRIEEVETALEQGADVNRKNWSGQTLLHEAAENGIFPVSSLFLFLLLYVSFLVFLKVFKVTQWL